MTQVHLRKKLDTLVKGSSKPIAIYDLDGTLFDVRHRTTEIMRRFTQLPEAHERFPKLVEIAARLKHDDYVYGLEESLTKAGIDHYSEHAAHFLHAAESFWYKNFFTDELLAFDQPYPGALACVRHLFGQGVQVVYLSGRDIPNMSRGTISSLERHGFPHSGHNVTICLKPAYGQDDLLFKKQSLETISQQGEVILTMDNEPANVQLFCDRYPEAVNVHFNSHYAKELKLKGANLHVVHAFGEMGFEDAEVV